MMIAAIYSAISDVMQIVLTKCDRLPAVELRDQVQHFSRIQYFIMN